MRQHELFSHTKACVSYDDTKFTDDASTPDEKDVCRVGQSKPKKMRSLVKNKPTVKVFLSLLLFEHLIIFGIAVWENVKPGSPKKGY